MLSACREAVSQAVPTGTEETLGPLQGAGSKPCVQRHQLLPEIAGAPRLPEVTDGARGHGSPSPPQVNPGQSTWKSGERPE